MDDTHLQGGPGDREEQVLGPGQHQGKSRPGEGQHILRQAGSERPAGCSRLGQDTQLYFSKGDLYVTCKFTDEYLAQIGGDYAELSRLLGNFLRRLRRKLRKLGVELKWVAVPSEKDGETGAQKRLHVHMVLTGAGIQWRDGAWYVGEETLEDIWGMGSIYAEPLRGQHDYTPVALYMLRQARRDVPDAKAYTTSRNMIQPEITERIVHTSNAMRQPARAYLLESSQYDAATGCHYIRYLAPENNEKRRRDGG